MAKEKILVVDDEEDIRELISFNLEKDGYIVETAESGERAMEMAFSFSPDLIVLDLMLPGIDGLEVAKKLKTDSTSRMIPIIMLTAKGEEADVVIGLEMGADDYIVKPFSPRVLTARIKAVLRRGVKTGTSTDEAIHIHNLLIDQGRRQVTADGKLIELTYTEFQVLFFSGPAIVLSFSQAFVYLSKRCPGHRKTPATDTWKGSSASQVTCCYSD